MRVRDEDEWKKKSFLWEKIDGAKLGRSCDRYFYGMARKFYGSNAIRETRDRTLRRDHSLPHVSLKSCFPMPCAFALTHKTRTAFDCVSCVLRHSYPILLTYSLGSCHHAEEYLRENFRVLGE